MITVFIDDSGTAPGHKVAIAAGMIVESSRVKSLDREFVELGQEEGFSYFHTSECVAGNKESEFSEWDSEKRQRVCSRIRQIAMRYGVSACSIAIDRNLYDEVVPVHMRNEGGKFHYTWAVGYLVEMLDHWATRQGLNTPSEFIFDWMGENKRNAAKKEIEAVMAKAEERRPGHYKGHYNFGRSKDIPGLQCADMLAWSCYQFALFKLAGIPPNDIGRDSFWDFEEHRPKGSKWLLAMVQTREQLEQWVAEKLRETRNDPRDT
jgi:Protein of unknown function (DUF3800)